MSNNDFKVSMNSPQFKILDSMIDGVRLLNKYNTVIHTNQYLEQNIISHTIGKKCYEGIGKREACQHCISEETFVSGKTFRKHEVINDRHYLVISSPVYDRYNNISAVVEVFRDITKEKELEESLIIKNEKMRNDIEFAQSMQINMLPIKGVYNDLQIDYFYKPSELLSGDMFDVFKIDKDCTGFYICDVVGHGISSSMISMYVKQTMRAISKQATDINAIMSELHRTFLALNFEDDKYFSIFFSLFDKNTLELKYINAGHNCEPLMKRNGQVSKLKAKGYPICNIFESVSYEVKKINLKVGDNILFYTDGITEMKNTAGEYFGEMKLIDLFQNEKNIINRIRDEIDIFDGLNSDDLALLDIKVI